MNLKPISSCGRTCFLFVGLLMAICCIVAVSGVYWSVWFWDCTGVGGDAYYYLVVDQGLCFDSSNDSSADDYATCTSWSDLADNTSGDESSDANSYNDAKGLGSTAASIAFLFMILTALTMFVGDSMRVWIRYAQIACMALCTLFVLIIMSSLSNTYYTDVDNYVFDSFCSSNATFPNSGGTFIFIGFITGLTATCCLVAPCGACLGDEQQEPLVNEQNQGQYGQNSSATTGTAQYGGYPGAAAAPVVVVVTDANVAQGKNVV